MTSWQIDGETVRYFIVGGSKITADGDCSHGLKRRKAMMNLDSVLKIRHITLPTKVHLIKAIVFPIVMYGCDSWTIKKAECRRIDAFELWCWTRLLGVPWTARRSNQSILKEISPEYSVEVLMLKLKLQYFGHLMRRMDSLEKTLLLGKIEGRRRRGWQRMRWLDGITKSRTWVWVNASSWWCYLTISTSAIPFSSCPQSFPSSESFPVSRLSVSGSQSIGASASVLPVTIQGLFHLGLTGLISFQCKGLSSVFSSTTIQRHQFFGT